MTIVIKIPSRWQAFKWRYFRLIPIKGLIPFIYGPGGFPEFISWNITLIYREIVLQDIYNQRPIMKRLGNR